MRNLYKNLAIGIFGIGGAELAVFGAQAAAQSPLMKTHEVVFFPLDQNSSLIKTQWLIDRRDECRLRASYSYKHSPSGKTVDFNFNLILHVPEGPSPNYPIVNHVSDPSGKALFSTNAFINKADDVVIEERNFYLSNSKNRILDGTRLFRGCPDFEFKGDEFFEKASLTKAAGEYWKLNLTLKQPKNNRPKLPAKPKPQVPFGKGKPVIGLGNNTPIVKGPDLNRIKIPDSVKANPAFQNKTNIRNYKRPGPIEDKNAQPIVRIPPSIPRRATKSGHCLMRFDVNNKGKPLNIVATSCTDRVFEHEAIKSVQKWEFKPRYVNRVSVARKGVETKVTFKLTDKNGNIIPE